MNYSYSLYVVTVNINVLSQKSVCEYVLPKHLYFIQNIQNIRIV